jgi:peptidoglycan hydrolase-like protein with peptidoglycan-binding domain
MMKTAKQMLATKGVYSSQTGTINESFDAALASAVLAYQAGEGMPKSGRLDTATLNRLGVVYSTEPPLPPKTVVQRVSSPTNTVSRPPELTGFQKTMSILGAVSSFRR